MTAKKNNPAIDERKDNQKETTTALASIPLDSTKRKAAKESIAKTTEKKMHRRKPQEKEVIMDCSFFKN